MKRKTRKAPPARLARYNEKRDFGITAEPSGDVRASESGRSFVVQKHDARRLHYDFRLELDGVLLSWAVPKGPSLSPKDRRLAVQTEDHPVDYRDFEGTIPEGEYGGGPVIVWDRGTWTPIGDPREGMKRGRLDFTLDGEKLHGRFLLVRTKKDEKGKASWLLMKRADEHVEEDGPIVDKLPQSVLTGLTIEEVANGKASTARGKQKKLPVFGKTEPQLATLVNDVPRGPWLYEPKYDGYRALTTLDEGEVRIASRNAKDWTDHFREIADAIAHVRAKTALFDGEIAYVLPDGRTDFQMLQNTLGKASASDRSRLVYFVFDLLHYDGVDLTGEPLSRRKDLLRTILAGEGPPLRLGDHMIGDGDAFFREACKLGLEGIVAKRADRPYVEGRGKDWVKIKCQQRQELVIVGMTTPKGGRKGIGALLLAVREGKKYRYAGKVGTGFTQASLLDLAKRLGTLIVETPPVVNAPKMRDVTWVRPELVCQVRFTEWTRDGVLRHPAFEGLREDKKATQAIHEKPQPAPAPKKTARAATRKDAPKAASKSRKTKTSHDAKPRATTESTLGIKVSHPDRIVDEGTGLTKLDVVRYHALVAPLMIPFAKKRPLMLRRATETGSTFIQKHASRGLQQAKYVIGDAAGGEEILYVDNPRGLVELAQYNAAEIHGWGSRMPKPERPDWIVLDLDPDEALPFSRVVEAAIEVRDALSSIDLESFVKTTGGKGLHVVVPIAARYDWNVVRPFAERIARAIVAQAPDRYVANMSKKVRRGKIFIDYLRNAEGATAILPYSPRARAGLPIAMPIGWRDLAAIDPQELTVLEAEKYLARRRKDPWADLLSTKQILRKDVLGDL